MVQAQREQKTGRSGLPYWRTSFVTPHGDDDPQAYLIENSPAMTIASHFHDVDQYQVFVKGEGAIGRKEVEPVSVHFARAFTTYGPIESRGEGLGWMTLRPRRDLGAKMIDTHRETLRERRDRQPWQTTVPVDFTGAADARATEVIGAEGGLSARAMALAAGHEAVAGDPSVTPCQYILVTGGSLLHEGREHAALTVVHVPPTDAPFRLVAGAHGLKCLVLEFPKDSVAEPVVAAPAAGTAAGAAAAGHEAEHWHCELCGFVYDVAEGLPAQGIAPGTPWSAIPADFQCPDCAATKQDFVSVAF